jgi:hypothetical protein
MQHFPLNYIFTDPAIFIYTKRLSLYIKAAFTYSKVNAR